MLAELQTYAPVLALTVLDASTFDTFGAVTVETKVLLGVRDPNTNASHPSVVSVPTRRIPQSNFDSITKSAIHTFLGDGTTAIFTESPINNGARGGHTDILFLVDSLLATKLGVSDHLERRAIKYRAHIMALVYGTVHHPDYSEDTAMLNAVVAIEQGADLFPPQTPSYSRLMWRSVGVFLDSARRKDPVALDPSLGPIEYCIHGMCVKSSFNVLAHFTKSPLYPFDPYSNIE